jgi:hypothetical protein
LTLPVDLQNIPNVFHVSQLRKYFTDSDHVMNDTNVESTPDMSYMERPIQIIDHEVKKLMQKTIPVAKVL